MSNPTDHTTFTALGTYTSSSTTDIDNYSLNITGVPAGITTLALRHTGAPAYSILVDDVSMSQCRVVEMLQHLLRLILP